MSGDDVAGDRPQRHALRGSGWSRRNRWGLATLPLAVVAALVASSDRVQLYFWEEGLRRPQSAVQGSWVDFRDTYTDAEGEHVREVRVRLDGVEPATTPWESTEPVELPPGTRALTVRLSLTAGPDLPLSVCSLAVRDADGTRYDYLSGVAGMAQPVSPCVPPDAPGPFPAMGDLDLKGAAGDDEPRRPASWTVAPVIVVPDDAEISEVVLWWEMPDYVALTVSD